MVKFYEPERPRKLSNELRQVSHFNQPVLMEKHPITVAQVRTAKGEKLHECVLVHPRYAKEHLSPSVYDIITVLGYRNGRSIDVLLDVPFEHEGKQYGILNFKGAGARALDKDPYGFIHPTKWYVSAKGWIPVERADADFMRCFGALKRRDAYNEQRDKLLPSLGIPQAPHVAANPFPDALNSAIYAEAGEWPKHRFSQLVRAFDTNMRMSDITNTAINPFAGLDTSAMERLVRALAKIDAQVLIAQIRLARKCLMLGIAGDIDENRFFNGQFTDAENYKLDPFNSNGLNDSARFVINTMHSSSDAITMSVQSSRMRERMHKIYQDSFCRCVDSPLFTRDYMQGDYVYAVRTVIRNGFLLKNFERIL
ncbi:TPA: hypothetical protein HA249_02530 [Candidatus Woesearchaeota archaeon]|nr:hypothetical protein [Candidatus Woesearchaeota archaeon]